MPRDAQLVRVKGSAQAYVSSASSSDDDDAILPADWTRRHQIAVKAIITATWRGINAQARGVLASRAVVCGVLAQGLVGMSIVSLVPVRRRLSRVAPVEILVQLLLVAAVGPNVVVQPLAALEISGAASCLWM